MHKIMKGLSLFLVGIMTTTTIAFAEAEFTPIRRDNARGDGWRGDRGGNHDSFRRKRDGGGRKRDGDNWRRGDGKRRDGGRWGRDRDRDRGKWGKHKDRDRKHRRDRWRDRDRWRNNDTWSCTYVGRNGRGKRVRVSSGWSWDLWTARRRGYNRCVNSGLRKCTLVGCYRL